MALTVLVEARPMRADDAVPVVVRLAGLGSRPYTHAGVNDWWAGVTDAPRFASMLGFGQGGWTGGAIPTTGAIAFAPSDRARIDALVGLVWDDAAVTIWTGDDALADPVWTVELNGTVAGVSSRDGTMTITVSDLSKKLARPIAADRFTGKGGIEGGSDAGERLKRRSFGRCWGVEARLLDKAANIHEVGDPARPLASIDVVKDRGRAASAIVVVAWAGSIAATLDALKAAAVPEGGAAVAPSIACLKWWTQPSGPLTVDLRGEVGTSYVETVAEIAVRIIDGAGLQPINAAAAVAIRPGAAGLHIDSDSETAGQALDRLLLRASLLWLLEPAGAVRLMPIGFDAAAPVIDAVDASREASFKPVTRVVLGYQRNHRPHNAGEISAVFQASDGTYADGTPIEELKPAVRGADVTGANTAAGIFGQGAFATQSRLDLDNGSFFTQPGRFQAYPGNANFFGAWKIAFGDGAGLDALQPGEAGANVTEWRTASAILGQSIFATLAAGTSLDNPVFGLPERLLASTFGPAFLRANNIAFVAGNTVEGLRPGEAGANVTELRTAAALLGQGVLATRDVASWLTQIVGRPMNVANLVNRPTFADGSRGDWGAHGATTVVDVAGQPFAKAGRSTLRDTLEDGNIIPVTEGEALYFDVWLNAEESAVGIGAGVFVRDKSGGVSFPLPVSVPAGTGWTRRTARYVVAPGVVSVQPWVQCNYEGSGSSAAKWAEFQLTRAQLGATVGGRIGTDVFRENGAIATDATLVTALGIASGFLGQSSWATFGASTSTIQKLGNDGNLPASGVYLPGVAFLNERWPDEAGSNRTEGRTAAALLGQGALATLSSVRLGSPSPDYPGFTSLINQTNGYYVTDAAAITSQGTAGAIAGQTAFATLPAGTSLDSSVFGMPSRLGSHGGYLSADQMTYTGGPATVSVASLRPGEAGANVTEARTAAALLGQGALATLSNVRLGSPSPDYPGFTSLINQTNGYYVTDAAAITSQGTAGGIAGQGALATADRIQADSQLGGSIANRLIPFPGDVNYLGARRIAWDEGSTVQSYKPEEGGSNRTETRTAGAIAGQTAFATLPAGTSLDSGVFGMPSRLGSHGGYLSADQMTYTGGPATVSVASLRPGEAGANVTEARTAAALLGQGALATLSNVRLGSPSPDYPGFTSLINQTNGYYVTDAAAITSQGTAGGIAGQGALATQSAVSYRTQVADLPVALTQGPGLGIRADGTSDPFFATWNDGVRMSDRQPGEANANRTETRVASAVAGQGALATAPQIGSWNVASYYNFSAFKLDYSITRSDGVSIVTEALSITQYGVAAAFAGQGTLATKDQAGAGDLAPSAVQQLAYTVLQQTITCGIGN